MATVEYNFLRGGATKVECNGLRCEAATEECNGSIPMVQAQWFKCNGSSVMV